MRHKVNDFSLELVPYAEALTIVNDRNILKKCLKFMNSNEYQRRRYALSTDVSSLK